MPRLQHALAGEVAVDRDRGRLARPAAVDGLEHGAGRAHEAAVAALVALGLPDVAGRRVGVDELLRARGGAHVVREQVRADQDAVGVRSERHPPRRQHRRQRERLVIAQRRAGDPRFGHGAAEQLGYVAPEDVDVGVRKSLCHRLEHAFGAAPALDPLVDDHAGPRAERLLQWRGRFGEGGDDRLRPRMGETSVLLCDLGCRVTNPTGCTAPQNRAHFQQGYLVLARKGSSAREAVRQAPVRLGSFTGRQHVPRKLPMWPELSSSTPSARASRSI